MSDAFRLPAASQFDHQSPDVIVRQQLAVQVYGNANGDVTIIQCADWCDEDDSQIVVTLANAELLAQALWRVVAEARRDRDEPEIVTSPPAPRNANALRQRRYRDRKKGGAEPVTGAVTRNASGAEQRVTRDNPTSLFAAPAREQRDG